MGSKILATATSLVASPRRFSVRATGWRKESTMDFLWISYGLGNSYGFPMDLAFLLWEISLWIYQLNFGFMRGKCPGVLTIRDFDGILMDFIGSFISLKSSSHNCTLSWGTRCLSASCPSHKHHMASSGEWPSLLVKKTKTWILVGHPIFNCLPLMGSISFFFHFRHLDLPSNHKKTIMEIPSTSQFRPRLVGS